MGKRRIKFKIVNGKFPSRMWKELSGVNERNAIIDGSKRIGRQLTRTAKAGIQNSPKAGNVYYHRRAGKTRASLPGAYPASQSGKLRRSVKFRLQRFSLLRFGATAEHAKYLQQSETPSGARKAGTGRMPERPFLTKAHNANKKFFKRVMQNSVMDHI